MPRQNLPPRKNAKRYSLPSKFIARATISPASYLTIAPSMQNSAPSQPSSRHQKCFQKSAVNRYSPGGENKSRPLQKNAEDFMSAVGMLGANVLESLVSNTTQSHAQKFKQDFQQLGQDLQSGNVTRGQADLTALQLDIPQPSSSTPSPLTQTFNQLAQDLQSGNLTAAQSDYATLQQDLHQGQGGAHQHHFRAHHSAGGSSSAQSQAQQELAQLGQALQSGNLTAAQQAYASFQTDIAGLAPLTGGTSTSASSSAPSSDASSLNIAA